jgi:hypothetical protein
MRSERIQEWLRLEALSSPGPAGVPGEVAARQDEPAEPAEAAFARLLALLPVLAPSPDFALRVDARLLQASRRSPWTRWLGSWGVRAATAWVAAQAAILIAIGSAVIGGLAASLGPVRLVGGLVSGSAAALEWVLDSLRMSVRVAEISQSSLVAVGPMLLVSLLVCIAASALGVALMSPLYAPHGSPRGAMR